jgi:predicted O-methyltransferase YrrM
MAQVDDLVTLIVKTFEEAARDFRDPLSFIFIDGAHEYEAAKLDFDLWFPKILNGGVIAFHDTILLSGPKRVAMNYLYKSKYFKMSGLSVL